MNDFRCPACTDDYCACRAAEDLTADAAPTRRRVAAAAVALPPLEPVAVRAARRADGVWDLRPVEGRSTAVTWSLVGGPCEGHYEAVSTWPPPEIIRAVHGVAGTAVLDLPADVVEDGEEVLLYRLRTHGFMCDGKSSPLWASYIPGDFTDEEEMRALREAAGPAQSRLVVQGRSGAQWSPRPGGPSWTATGVCLQDGRTRAHPDHVQCRLRRLAAQPHVQLHPLLRRLRPVPNRALAYR